MTDKEIFKMLKDLLYEADFYYEHTPDYHDEWFIDVDGCRLEISHLTNIVKKHIEKSKWNQAAKQFGPHND